MFDVAGVTKTIQDGRSFMGRANTDKLAVEISGNHITATIQPTLLNETDALSITSHTALAASRAVFERFPEAQSLMVALVTEFTTATGQKTMNRAAMIQVNRATAASWAYDGLRTRVQSDNKHLFCLADKYQIHPAVYAEVKDKGCLRGAAKL
jgi:hypothetical protein